MNQILLWKMPCCPFMGRYSSTVYNIQTFEVLFCVVVVSMLPRCWVCRSLFIVRSPVHPPLSSAYNRTEVLVNFSRDGRPPLDKGRPLFLFVDWLQDRPCNDFLITLHTLMTKPINIHDYYTKIFLTSVPPRSSGAGSQASHTFKNRRSAQANISRGGLLRC